MSKDSTIKAFEQLAKPIKEGSENLKKSINDGFAGVIEALNNSGNIEQSATKAASNISSSGNEILDSYKELSGSLTKGQEMLKKTLSGKQLGSSISNQAKGITKDTSKFVESLKNVSAEIDSVFTSIGKERKIDLKNILKGMDKFDSTDIANFTNAFKEVNPNASKKAISNFENQVYRFLKLSKLITDNQKNLNGIDLNNIQSEAEAKSVLKSLEILKQAPVEYQKIAHQYKEVFNSMGINLLFQDDETTKTYAKEQEQNILVMLKGIENLYITHINSIMSKYAKAREDIANGIDDVDLDLGFRVDKRVLPSTGSQKTAQRREQRKIKESNVDPKWKNPDTYYVKSGWAGQKKKINNALDKVYIDSKSNKLIDGLKTEEDNFKLIGNLASVLRQEYIELDKYLGSLETHHADKIKGLLEQPEYKELFDKVYTYKVPEVDKEKPSSGDSTLSNIKEKADVAEETAERVEKAEEKEAKAVEKNEKRKREARKEATKQKEEIASKQSQSTTTEDYNVPPVQNQQEEQNQIEKIKSSLIELESVTGGSLSKVIANWDKLDNEVKSKATSILQQIGILNENGEFLFSNKSGGNAKAFIINDFVILQKVLEEDLDITSALISKIQEAKNQGVNVAEIYGRQFTSLNSSSMPKGFVGGYEIQELAQGKELHQTMKGLRTLENSISENQLLLSATKEQLTKFVKDWIALNDLGLRVDPSKSSNFFYDIEKGFEFIDLGLKNPNEKPISAEYLFREMVTALTDTGSVFKYKDTELTNITGELAGRLAEIFKELGLMSSEQLISLIDENYIGWTDIVKSKISENIIKPKVNDIVSEQPTQALEQEEQQAKETTTAIEEKNKASKESLELAQKIMNVVGATRTNTKDTIAEQLDSGASVNDIIKTLSQDKGIQNKNKDLINPLYKQLREWINGSSIIRDNDSIQKAFPELSERTAALNTIGQKSLKNNGATILQFLTDLNNKLGTNFDLSKEADGELWTQLVNTLNKLKPKWDDLLSGQWKDNGLFNEISNLITGNDSAVEEVEREIELTRESVSETKKAEQEKQEAIERTTEARKRDNDFTIKHMSDLEGAQKIKESHTVGDKEKDQWVYSTSPGQTVTVKEYEEVDKESKELVTKREITTVTSYKDIIKKAFELWKEIYDLRIKMDSMDVSSDEYKKTKALVDELDNQYKDWDSQIKKSWNDPNAQAYYQNYMNTETGLYMAKKELELTNDQTKAKEKLIKVQEKYNAKLASVNNVFKGSKEYLDVENAISSLLNAKDTNNAISNIDNLFNILETNINKYKQNVIGSSTLDPVASANNRYKNLENSIDGFVADFQAMGYSAEEAERKVEKLRYLLLELQEIEKKQNEFVLNPVTGINEPKATVWDFGEKFAEVNEEEQRIRKSIPVERKQKRAENQKRSLDLKKDLRLDQLSKLENSLRESGNLTEAAKNGIDKLLDSLSKVSTSSELSQWNDEFKLFKNQLNDLPKTFQEQWDKTVAVMDENASKQLANERKEILEEFVKLPADTSKVSGTEWKGALADQAKQEDEERLRKEKEAQDALNDSIERFKEIQKEREKSGKVKNKNANVLIQEEIKALERLNKLEIEKTEAYKKGQDTTDIQKKIDLEKEYIARLEEELVYYKRTQTYKDKDSILDNKENELNIEYDKKVNKGRLDFDVSEEEAWKLHNALEEVENNLKSIKAAKGLDDNDLVTKDAEQKIEALNEKLINTKNIDNSTLVKYFKDTRKILEDLDSVVHITSPNLSKDDITKEVADYINIITNGKAKIEGFDYINNKVFATFKDGQGDIRKIALEYDSLTGALRQVKDEGKKTQSTFDKIFSFFKEKGKNLLGYVLSFASFYEIWAQIRQGVTYVRELNTALTEMRKVSDESVGSLEKFQKASFDTASSIGTTAKQIQDSTSDFMRLGYELEQASKLANDANIYANVGDMEIDEATEHMISSIKAWESEFDSEVEASAAIVDRYNEIGNNFAISSADIGSAMERSAAALKAGGNTLNESLGLITAGNVIQQDAETTAAALKILALRIRGSKAELEEMGESTDDLASSSSKLREKIKGLSGVDIMLDEDTYKSTAQIIKELGAVYNQMSDVSQASLLETIAGKNRASTIEGLLQNYKIIDEVISAAENADGSALKENEKYLESIDGKIEQLTNSIQEFWYTVLDTDTVTWVLDSLTSIINLVTDLIDKFGVLPSLMGTAGGAFGVFQSIKGGGRAKNFVVISKLITHRSLIKMFI